MWIWQNGFLIHRNLALNSISMRKKNDGFMVEINLNVYFSDYDKLQIFSTCHVLFIFVNFCLWLHHNLFAFACFFFLGRLFFRIRNIRIFGFCWVGRRCRHLRRRLVIFLGWMNRIWWRLIMKVFLKLYEMFGHFEYPEARLTRIKNIEVLIVPEIFRSPLGCDIYRTMILPNCIDHHGFVLLDAK